LAPNDWEPKDVSALHDLAHIVMDDIAVRLEIAKRRETEFKKRAIKPTKRIE
jgi:hypothetical protein